jgi:cyanophycin synthetase
MAGFMVTARMIMSELEARDIVVDAAMPERVSVLSFEYNGKPRLIIGCTPDFSSALTIPVCRSKMMTQWLLSRTTSVPLPATLVYTTDAEAEAFLHRYGVLVVKPQDGAHGNGVTVGVDTMDKLLPAVALARQYSATGRVLLQQMVSGRDVRVLVVDGAVVAATYRIPASVVGDGTSTIRQLIDTENQTNPDRGEKPYDKRMNRIDVAAATRFLGEAMEVVPAGGEKVTVVGTANIGTGGESHECLDELPEVLTRHALDAATAARSFICGVDFVYDSTTGAYYLIELNSSPSFGLHAFPSVGKPTDIAPLYVTALLKRYDSEGDK